MEDPRQVVELLKALAGELPAVSTALSPGTGPVDIYNNLIQANLGNDDGGGIRFLMAGGPGGTDAMNVYNNIIVNYWITLKRRDTQKAISG